MASNDLLAQIRRVCISHPVSSRLGHGYTLASTTRPHSIEDMELQALHTFVSKLVEPKMQCPSMADVSAEAARLITAACDSAFQ